MVLSIKIYIESRESVFGRIGSGTTVHIYLPIAEYTHAISDHEGHEHPRELLEKVVFEEARVVVRGELMVCLKEVHQSQLIALR